LTAYDLLCPVLYRELQNFSIEAYQAIIKFGWQYNIENQENITQKKLNDLLVEQYRQTFPKEYMHLLKVLKESEVLTDKNLEHIRMANRAMEKKYQSIEKNLLITELDDLVMNMTQWNAENDT